MTRNQAIAAFCKSCVHDPEASGTWREQTGICCSADCPLWTYRPLPRNAPPWLRTRDPLTLPDGFTRMGHDDAVACLRSGNKVTCGDGE